MGSVKYGKESLNKIPKYKWQSCYFYDLQISRWLAQFRQYYFCRFSVATSWFLFYQTCWRCCDWARQSLQSLQIHQMSSVPLTLTAKQDSLGHHRVASPAEEQIRKWTHTPGPTLLFQMQSKHGRCLNVKIFSEGRRETWGKPWRSSLICFLWLKSILHCFKRDFLHRNFKVFRISKSCWIYTGALWLWALCVANNGIRYGWHRGYFQPLSTTFNVQHSSSGLLVVTKWSSSSLLVI